MAIKKATIQQQVAEALAQANPADRPIVTIQAVAGPSVWLMSMLGLIGQAFLTYYFITLTEQSVVIHKASRMSNRPQEIVYALPPAQVGAMIGDVRRNTIWSAFHVLLPGQPKPTRMNVHRIWRGEMDHLLGLLTGAQTPAH
ncbi:hypothetical protein E2C00_09675 [Streptomyces sp. WAC05374]|uniref:hypothetical protein n=1 Tax=unclassified Streptomyces TaxID=2593676 RepID=UPI000F87EB7A|nr:hypothetical protein [Streptomyces sp. WAC05374]RST13413.1 hypothetical protein EF905_20355 [Streptomyces sp. WAC05374]TDF47066.1 hypothetical protein E2B92_08505 [Streptomyces sp. WAC05374]TDF57322.1 hypothetical protein E2C00_09675 [Streptomyces sp. WAC05374]TDF61427.1 hypothetical protein E2C02_00875 [Streptomyces sp. WAC05374]